MTTLRRLAFLMLGFVLIAVATGCGGEQPPGDPGTDEEANVEEGTDLPAPPPIKRPE